MGDSNAVKRALGEAVRTEGGCIEVAALEAYVEGTLAPEERERVAGHLNRCGRCGAELKLFESFREATPSPAEKGDVEWIARRLHRKRPAAARAGWRSFAALLEGLPSRNLRGLSLVAASLIVAVAAGIYWRRASAPALDTGAGDRAAVYRSAGIQDLNPAGDLPSAPAEFRWNPVPGAADYELQLFEVDRTALWSVHTTAAGQRPPPAVLQLMAPGKTLLWKVSAFDAGGRRIAESGLQEFRVVVSQ